MRHTRQAVMLAAIWLGLSGASPLRAQTTQPSASQATVIEASPGLMPRLRIATVGLGDIGGVLRIAGRVELDKRRLAKIGATVTGRISTINVQLGDDVTKGQWLATLNSTELGAAQSAYLKAQSQMHLHRLAVSRARRLLAGEVIGSAELQERESELREAEVDLRAAADHLRVLGVAESNIRKLAATRTIHSVSPVTATLAGTVIEHNVTLGQVVQPSDAMFTVADLSHVWIVAELPEQQISYARIGDAVDAEIAALPDRKIHGRVIYVGDVVNPETRTVTLRMDLPNPDQAVKPKMLATLLVRQATERGLTIPAAAVVRYGDQDHVFVELGERRFEDRIVSLGAAQHGSRSVLSGLRRGERIVIDGAFHLHNERLRGEPE